MSTEWGPNGFVPWRHQTDGLEAMRKHAAYALLDDVGCGKTAPLVMRIAEVLKEERKSNPHARCVYISEAAPVLQLPRDFQALVPELDVRVITGKMTSKEKKVFWGRPPDVICTNFEYVKSIEQPLHVLVKAGHIPIVVVDEAHRLGGYRGPRSSQGKQAARIVKLFKGCKYKYLASASLMDNPDSPRVWGPIHFLDPGVFPSTIGRFESEFFDNFSPTYRYKQLKLKPSMVEELTRRLQQISRRVLLEDTGAEVPERIIKDLYVPMSPKLRKFYRELRDDALAWHDNRPISRAEVLSRNAALLQVASGFIIDHPDPLEVMAAKISGGEVPEHQIVRIDTSHKDDALSSLCNELSRKDQLIVWAHFTHEVDWLLEMLPDLRKSHISMVDGRVTGSDRDEAIRAFQEGRTNTFLGQPGACGAGLNLQCAQHMCRWSRSHFIVHHNQSYGRNRRALRDQLFKKIVYHSVMTDQTVDVRTEMRNRGKREFAGQILLEHLSYEERNLL